MIVGGGFLQDPGGTGNLVVEGNSTFSGGGNFYGALGCHNSLTVQGTSTLTEDVTVGGNISQATGGILTNSIVNNGFTWSEGLIWAATNLQVGGNLLNPISGSGNMVVTNNLSVGGTSTLTGDITGNNNLYIKGKTAIGTDAIASMPGSYDLYVGGSGILATGLKVAAIGGSYWADFVFNKNYDLMPLSEVAEYVSENKHLPEVPSAKEVEKDGIDVVGMDAKLLQKIEELTLYAIQQQKEIEQQNKEIETLKKEMKK